MKFILHSQIGEESIRYNLGRPDYSYYFMLKAYRLALMELGSVELVRHPETEVDPIFKMCASRGEACVYLSFAPPNKTPLNLQCPTVPVITWGFSNIPDEVWDDDPRNDWRFVLARLGCAITVSSHAARAIAASMGLDFPVSVISPPVMARAIDAWRYVPPSSELGRVELATREVVIDSSNIDLAADIMGPSTRSEVVKTEPQLKPNLNNPISHHQTRKHPALRRRVTKAVSRIIVTGPSANAAPALETRVSAGGVVYTSVLNPMAGHKNWVELVTAFCWAFRDVCDATLILKMVQQNLPAYGGPFVDQLSRLSPFKCRVIALHGYFEDSEYEKLISMTTYYVNASKSEGLCRPLMEFLACGRPAISPTHTAMADYIDNSIAFVLRANPELGVWPHDSRERVRSMQYRLDWESLLDAFRQSYHLAKDSPELYSVMGERARRKMQEFYSIPIIAQKLREHFVKSGTFNGGTADEIVIVDKRGVLPAGVTVSEPT